MLALIVIHSHNTIIVNLRRKLMELSEMNMPVRPRGTGRDGSLISIFN